MKIAAHDKEKVDGLLTKPENELYFGVVRAQDEWSDLIALQAPDVHFVYEDQSHSCIITNLSTDSSQ